jgi:hypothetical protein
VLEAAAYLTRGYPVPEATKEEAAGEEMRMGLALGAELFPKFAEQVGGTPERTRILVEAFSFFYTHLATTEAVLDTYIFCLSEHRPDDRDGLLSMWREYGAKGNGAALVFNTQKLHYQQHSPLRVAKVEYATREQRAQKLEKQFAEWAKITQQAALADDRLYVAAYAIFSFVKALALCTKHVGFSEEREWRVSYLSEHDPFGYLKCRLDYFIGPRGIEPKLKYKFGKVYRSDPLVPDAKPLETRALTDILEFILLGPSVSSPLSKLAFLRMLKQLGKDQFADRVLSSTIPLRPQS